MCSARCAPWAVQGGEPLYWGTTMLSDGLLFASDRCMGSCLAGLKGPAALGSASFVSLLASHALTPACAPLQRPRRCSLEAVLGAEPSAVPNAAPLPFSLTPTRRRALIEGDCVDVDDFPAGTIFVSNDFSTAGSLTPIK